MKMQGGMFVKSLFSYADAYIKNCTWKDLALVKFCLCAIGVMIGLKCSKGEKEDSVSGVTSRFSGDLFPFDGEIYPCHKSRTEKNKQHKSSL